VKLGAWIKVFPDGDTYIIWEKPHEKDNKWVAEFRGNNGTYNTDIFHSVEDALIFLKRIFCTMNQVWESQPFKEFPRYSTYGIIKCEERFAHAELLAK